MVMLRRGEIVDPSVANTEANLFRCALPDREPYEGKVTQKQKQFIWDLGYREQEVIDQLGKKQAAFLIDQLIKHNRKQRRRQSAKRWAAIFILSLLALIAGTVAARFTAGKHGDAPAVLGAMGMMLSFPMAVVRYIASL